MSNKKHQVENNLVKSIGALTGLLFEQNFAKELAFHDRPQSTKDSVPAGPFWTPKNCYLYALNRFHKPWPAAEAIISNDPKSAVEYAINLLDDAWPDDENGRHAEKLISKDPGRALWYAKMVKGRWEQIEPAMASKANWAYEYAKHVLEHQWNGPYAIDAENSISKDPYIATLYCMDLKYPKRYDNPRTERMILDSVYGPLYAHSVAPQMTIDEINQEVDENLKALNAGQNIDFSEVFEESWESWTDAATLKPDPETSRPIVLVYYAQEKLKNRWPEAEPYILEKCRRNESLDEIMNLFAYAINVIKPYDKRNPNYDRGRWLEAEPIIKTDSHVAYNYALAILKERWPDPEVELLILNSDSAKYYAEYVAKTSEDELREDVERKLYDLNRHDDIDLSDTIEEGLKNTTPLIVEGWTGEDEMRALTLYNIALDKKKANEAGLTPKQESQILKSAAYAYKYAKNVLEDEWPEAEPILLTSDYYAYNYAKNVIKGRWEAAEPLILTGMSSIALSYATKYKIRLDPMVELRIIKSYFDEDDEDHWIFSQVKDYCTQVVKMSVKDLKAEYDILLSDLTSEDNTDLSSTVEEAIHRLMPLISENELDPVNQDVMRRTAVECYVHANYVLKKPWPKAEPKILTHPYASFLYAKEVIEGPWPKAEEIISTHAKSARLYAQYVLKRRFIEGEDAIKRDPEEAYYYAENVLKPFDSIEKNPSYNNGRWEDPKTELLILNAPWELPYAERIAGMTRKDLIAELEYKMKDISPNDDKDFTDTTEEAIDRLLPLITESEEEPDFEKMTPHDAYDYVWDYKRKHKDSPWREPDPRAARIIMKDPHLAQLFATFFINQGRSLGIRWREAEPIIKTKASSAYNYAKNVMKGRWREAEDVIKKDTFYAYFYALEVIKPSGRKNYDYENGRWDLETETRILQDHDLIVPDEDNTEPSEVCELYALRVAEMSLSDLIADVVQKTKDIRASDNIDLSDTAEEDVINTLPVILEAISNEDHIRAINLYHDAKDKKQANEEGLTPEEEKAILKVPEYAYKYAAYVLEREWPEAESIILTVPYWASKYAENVVKGRWEAAEPILMQCPERALSYALNASRTRLNPAIEHKLFELAGRYEGLSNLRLHEQFSDYASNVAKMSLEDLEADVKIKLSAITDGDDLDLSSTVEEAIGRLMPLICESHQDDESQAMEAFFYARDVIGGPSPEREPILKKDPFWAVCYANQLSLTRWDPVTELKILEMGNDNLDDHEGEVVWVYANEVAKMSVEDLIADVQKQLQSFTAGDDINLSATTDEGKYKPIHIIQESAYDDIDDYFDETDCPAKVDFYYARDIIGGPCPERENEILKSPEWSYRYAKEVVGGKWVNGEDTIMKDPIWAIAYAKKVTKARLDPIGELRILQTWDAFDRDQDWDNDTYDYFLSYVTDVAKMPLDDLRADLEEIESSTQADAYIDLTDTTEEAIDRLMPLITEGDEALPDFKKMTPVEAFEYVYTVINKGKYLGIRCPEAEPIIAKNAELAYFYAMSVINKDQNLGKRWSEAELVPGGLKDSPKFAYYYVKEVINRGRDYGERWYGCENAIITDKIATAMYAKNYAKMSVDEFLADVKSREESMSHRDDEDLSDTTDEAINRLMPIIVENKTARPDPSGWTADDCIDYLMAEDSWGKKGSWPEAEPMIKAEPHAAYTYAAQVLQEVWPEAEPVIMKQYNTAFYYARDVKKEAWPEAEPSIMRSPEFSFQYAYNILNINKEKDEEGKIIDGERWVDAEPVIKSNPISAYEYARYITGERWEPQVEMEIIDSGIDDLADMYAEDVAHMPLHDLKLSVERMLEVFHPETYTDFTDTFEESIDRLMPLINVNVNESIKKTRPDPGTMSVGEIFYYVTHIINKGKYLGIRWPDAEPYIMKDQGYAVDYVNHVINKGKNLGKRWPEAEPYIMKSPDNAYYYTRIVINKGKKLGRRWPGAEPYIMKDPQNAYYYAHYVINKGKSLGIRWPEAEPYIIKDPECAKLYAENVSLMPYEQFLAEVEVFEKALHQHDYIDLTDVEESIDRHMPLIVENKKFDKVEARPDPNTMSPDAAFKHFTDVINKENIEKKKPLVRWEEAEPIFAKDAMLAYIYAEKVINKDQRLGIRNEVLENGIRKEPIYSYFYVTEILNRGKDNGIRWPEFEKTIIKSEGFSEMYAKEVAKMPVDEFIAEVKTREAAMIKSDYEDLSGAFEESIDRLMPLITEANRKDYWGRRKEFKEFYPISNWLDKAINRLKARFRGAYTPKFQQSIIALKAKADEYREKGAHNFNIGADMFSSKEPYPPKDVLDDSSIPSSIKSLLVGAFHDEESKLNKEYEKSLADKWEHDWPAPIHKKQNSIQYDLRRRLQDERIKNRKELARHRDTTAQDDADLSNIDEE